MFSMLAALMASHARVATANQPDGKPYNVLFIAIDDLNDGDSSCNPQAITPNFDRYAKNHAMVMTRAYFLRLSAVRPDRLTGKHATHTGVYGNGQNLKHARRPRILKPCQNILATVAITRLAVEKFSISTATQMLLVELTRVNGPFTNLSKQRVPMVQSYGKSSRRWTG